MHRSEVQVRLAFENDIGDNQYTAEQLTGR